MSEPPVIDDSADPFRDLWSFSQQEIRGGRHGFPVRSILRSNPATSLLYAILFAIHEGIDMIVDSGFRRTVCLGIGLNGRPLYLDSGLGRVGNRVGNSSLDS